MMKIGLMPSRRSGEPKVKRLTPETESVPIVEIIKPRTAEARPFKSDLLDKEAMTERPSMPRPK